MSGRQTVLVALVAVTVLALTTGTGGFSAAEADRDVSVTLASDSNAYLGVKTYNPAVAAGQQRDVRLMGLTNQFGRDLTEIGVTVTGDEETPPGLQDAIAPGSLTPGTRGKVTAQINCDAGRRNPETETWTVEITASGDGVTVVLSRTVKVTCERDTSSGGPAGTEPEPTGTSR